MRYDCFRSDLRVEATADGASFTLKSVAPITSGIHSSIALGSQWPGEFTQEEQTARLRRHEGRWDPRSWLVAESHPERQSLPHHASSECAVCAANDLVTPEEQAGADRIGEGRDECRSALEARQRVLLDRERMELRAEAMCLLLPFVDGRELTGEVWLPEGDVADATDAEDHAQLGTFAP